MIYCIERGVSRISFAGGGGGGGEGQNIIGKWGCLHGEATSLLGVSGACTHENFFLNGAIWCVLENILLKNCQKNCKNIHFSYKNNR